MTIVNQFQLENARAKLRRFEGQYAALKLQTVPNPFTRDLTLQALQRWMKKLREEILRYECRVTSRP